MESFELTKIWRSTLSEHPDDPHKKSRDRLRSAFLDTRARAGHLTTGIPSALPMLTVHDLTHIDALWEMTDLILGDDLLNSGSSFITPAEAFVLGVAFLVHDLAQSRSAIPLSDEELKSSVEYQDILAQALSKQLGRPASKSEISSPTSEIEQLTLGNYLRERHAELAARLPTQGWEDRDGETHFLIQDEDIRRAFGEVSGTVAASHWLPARMLSEKLGPISGAPGWLPADWGCDPLKLACILRSADAIHLDDRRAPPFLQALRMPSGESAAHWDFQKRLMRPRREQDRLIFASSSSFPIAKAESWWKCYDTLRMVSTELWTVDALLADTRDFRFTARTVAGVEDPKLLARYITTDGWTPVDAQIKVSNVISLVEQLGGKELYGENVTVPLRELIQNGSDAVQARRRLSHMPGDWGTIDVSLKQENSNWILEVFDSGLGMSEDVLAGPLLDFGKSFWRSDNVRTEYPGLLSEGFEPTGRYGIGFFSVFMLGNRIEVTSKRYDDAARETRVLELNRGVRSRPILRQAHEKERLCDGGTRVKIWLESSPYEPGGFLAGNFNNLPKLELNEMCAWLCPSLPVDLRVRTGDGVYRTAVRANDWLTIGGEELLHRVLRPIPDKEANRLNTVIARNSGNVRDLIGMDGKVRGRGCILLQSRGERDNKSDLGPITVGGCRASALYNFGGIVIGIPLRASRDRARPFVEGRAVAGWATEQGRLMAGVSSDHELLETGAAEVRSMGGSVSNLPIARSKRGWMTPEDIEKYATDFEEIIILQDASFHFASENRELSLLEGVLVCNGGIWGREWPTEEPWTWNGSAFHFWTLQGAAMEAVARGWSLPLGRILECSDETTDDQEFERPIAITSTGETVSESVDIIRKPTK